VPAPSPANEQGGGGEKEKRWRCQKPASALGTWPICARPRAVREKGNERKRERKEGGGGEKKRELISFILSPHLNRLTEFHRPKKRGKGGRKGKKTITGKQRSSLICLSFRAAEDHVHHSCSGERREGEEERKVVSRFRVPRTGPSHRAFRSATANTRGGRGGGKRREKKRKVLHVPSVIAKNFTVFLALRSFLVPSQTVRGREKRGRKKKRWAAAVALVGSIKRVHHVVPRAAPQNSEP